MDVTEGDYDDKETLDLKDIEDSYLLDEHNNMEDKTMSYMAIYTCNIRFWRNKNLKPIDQPTD